MKVLNGGNGMSGAPTVFIAAVQSCCLSLEPDSLMTFLTPIEGVTKSVRADLLSCQIFNSVHWVFSRIVVKIVYSAM